MTVEEKISKAKIKMIMQQPFFATLALRMHYVADARVKTAETDGTTIFYNPQFMEDKDLLQTMFILAHEVMHPAMLHHTRRGNRNMKKWNRACDYPINEMLYNSGFDEAKNWLYDPQYFGMSAEQIYNMLPDEPEEDDKQDGQGDGGDQPQDNDPGGCGGFRDAPAQDEAQRTEIEAQIQESLAQAMMVAKQQGDLSSDMERFIKDLLKPKLDWQEILARYLSEIARNDYSFRRPNTRYLHSGFYLPSLYNEEVGEVVMFVDTSASIDDELLKQFGTEMQEVMSTFNKGFLVVYVDTKVHTPEYIESDEPVNLHPKGGGGTDFKPGFKYLDEVGMNPKAVVYFTDGECNSFPEIPDYPVLWAQTGMAKFEPPFGEVVKIV